MNGHQRKILQRILATPASGTIRFSDVESLLEALGAEVIQSKGSRVRFYLQGEQWHTHRPHPGNEAKRYQVRDLQELFQRLGIG